MNRSWLLYIALGVAIFVAITYAIFFYWNIDNNNKWSTFFSFTSTFGIIATIVVYYLQTLSDRKKINNIKNSLGFILDPVLKDISNLIKLKNENTEKEIMVTSLSAGILIHRGQSGLGFTINKFTRINDIDIYHSVLVGNDATKSNAISAIKEHLEKYNDIVDEIMEHVSQGNGYLYEKSFIIEKLKSRLDIIKILILIIKN
ncbi:hypothetical protein [Providencia alcalifaciens]|uniref:hypothetical protein n=1 Tax=Providencia alcalifaciens TaxID=126385 RepID=UPI0032DA61A7